MLHERVFACQGTASAGTLRRQYLRHRETEVESAADDALTREIEALRERLVGLGRDLAEERDSQEETTRELAALRRTIAAMDALQADVLSHLARANDD
jgi:chromosome segregation ATPase